MKLKLLLTSFIGAVAIGATAGEYCPPAPDKCPIEICPESGGNISFGYETDYIFYGVRLARDSVWADVNYTFDQLPLPVTIGVWHLSSLGSGANGNDNFGDETDLYASVALPAVMGFQTTIGYTHYMFPTTRTPSGTAGPRIGDSTNELWLKIEREVFCGINVSYRRAYDYNRPSAIASRAAGGLTNNNTDEGAWVHTLAMEKSICITEGIGLDLSGGVLYTDNYWPADTTALDGSVDRGRSAGWNNYYVKAALPVALTCNATLIPYVGYSGSPDSWIADGVNANIPGGNANDILHGGVSVRVSF